MKSREVVGQSVLLPVAVFAGLALVAAAVYFGLRSERTCSPQLPTASGAAPLAAPPRSAPETPRPSREVHHRGAFLTAWAPHQRDAERICRPTAIETRDDTRFVELGFELAVGADGSVTATPTKAPPRVVADDGSETGGSIDSDALSLVYGCYAREISQRVRFPPAAEPGRLEVRVPVRGSH